MGAPYCAASCVCARACAPRRAMSLIRGTGNRLCFCMGGVMFALFYTSPRRTPALHEALLWFAGARLAGSLLAEACNGLISSPTL